MKYFLTIFYYTCEDFNFHFKSLFINVGDTIIIILYKMSSILLNIFLLYLHVNLMNKKINLKKKEKKVINDEKMNKKHTENIFIK